MPRDLDKDPDSQLALVGVVLSTKSDPLRSVELN